ERPPRAHHARDRGRGGGRARCRLSHLARLWRAVPPRLGGAGGGRGMSSETESEVRELPRWLRLAVPLLLGLVFLAGWELLVRALGIPKFVLPAPTMIAEALLEDRATLMDSLWVTLGLTLAAFAMALLLGFAFAVLFAHSRLMEMSLFPYAVI